MAAAKRFSLFCRHKRWKTPRMPKRMPLSMPCPRGGNLPVWEWQWCGLFFSRLGWFGSTWNQLASTHCPDKAAHRPGWPSFKGRLALEKPTHLRLSCVECSARTANGVEASHGLLKLLKTLEVFESVVSSWNHFDWEQVQDQTTNFRQMTMTEGLWFLFFFVCAPSCWIS